MMRFTHNTRVREQERLTGPLTSMELRAAPNYLMSRAQVESFGEEIECLKRGQEIHKQSRIKSLHRTYHHPPTERLLNLIKQEHWIIHGRQAVQNVTFKYFYRQTVKPQEQHTGNLPECRLEPGIVFRNTGVDFFGPMLIKERRSEVNVNEY